MYFEKESLQNNIGDDLDKRNRNFEKIESDTTMMATNLVTNGDFSNGATGWNGSWDMVVTNGYMVATNERQYKYKDIVSSVGDKLFVSVNMRGVSDSKPAVWVFDYGTYTNMLEVLGVSGNVWVRKSMIFSPKLGGIRVMLNHYGRTLVMEAHYDDVIVINLTATFGAGKEPTVEQMDEIMSKFENSWFDGTANLFQANATLNKLMALGKEKANKVQEAWITPTLLNGFTGDVRYRKTETGMLQIVGKLESPTALGSEVLDIFTLPIAYIPVRFSNSVPGKFEIIEDAFYTFRTAKVVLSQYTKTVVIYAGQNATSWHFNICTPLD